MQVAMFIGRNNFVWWKKWLKKSAPLSLYENLGPGKVNTIKLYPAAEIGYLLRLEISTWYHCHKLIRRPRNKKRNQRVPWTLTFGISRVLINFQGSRLLPQIWINFTITVFQTWKKKKPNVIIYFNLYYIQLWYHRLRLRFFGCKNKPKLTIDKKLACWFPESSFTQSNWRYQSWYPHGLLTKYEGGDIFGLTKKMRFTGLWFIFHWSNIHTVFICFQVLKFKLRVKFKPQFFV